MVVVSEVVWFFFRVFSGVNIGLEIRILFSVLIFLSRNVWNKNFVLVKCGGVCF